VLLVLSPFAIVSRVEEVLTEIPIVPFSSSDFSKYLHEAGHVLQQHVRVVQSYT